MAKLKDEAYWVHIILSSVAVDCIEDPWLSPGNMNVEVVAYRWHVSYRTV